MKKAISGFTIVELLVVIVVIAILATISVVAYTGIQQRATNTAIVEAASESLRALQAYIAANGTYPVSSNVSMCVSSSTGCISDQGDVVNSNSTFDTAVGTIGSLPRNIPAAGTGRKGIYFFYNSGITVAGTNGPMVLAYYLAGTSQNCGMNNVVLYSWPNLPLSAVGYSSSNIAGTGTTLCWVGVPGPNV